MHVQTVFLYQIKFYIFLIVGLANFFFIFEPRLISKWNKVDTNSGNSGLSLELPIMAWLPSHGRPQWLSWMRRPTGDQEVAGSTPAEVGNILEIFSKVILSLPLIQEGQLSVSGERMCTILVNRLEN